MLNLIISIIITVFLISLMTFWIIIKRTKQAINNLDSQEVSLKEETTFLFFMTDGGNLLRKKKGVWEVFNAKTKSWEKPTFGIEDIFDAHLISREDAGNVLKKMLKSKR